VGDHLLGRVVVDAARVVGLVVPLPVAVLHAHTTVYTVCVHGHVSHVSQCVVNTMSCARLLHYTCNLTLLALKSSAKSIFSLHVSSAGDSSELLDHAVPPVRPLDGIGGSVGHAYAPVPAA